MTVHTTPTYSLKLRTAHAFTKRVLLKRGTIILNSGQVKISKEHIIRNYLYYSNLFIRMFENKREANFKKLPKNKKIGYYCHL